MLNSEKRNPSLGGCKVLWCVFSIEKIESLDNRKSNGVVGARRAFASMVGAAVVHGLEMRAAADDRGQPREVVKRYKISHGP